MVVTARSGGGARRRTSTTTGGSTLQMTSTTANPLSLLSELNEAQGWASSSSSSNSNNNNNINDYSSSSNVDDEAYGRLEDDAWLTVNGYIGRFTVGPVSFAATSSTQQRQQMITSALSGSSDGGGGDEVSSIISGKGFTAASNRGTSWYVYTAASSGSSSSLSTQRQQQLIPEPSTPLSSSSSSSSSIYFYPSEIEFDSYGAGTNNNNNNENQDFFNGPGSAADLAINNNINSYLFGNGSDGSGFFSNNNNNNNGSSFFNGTSSLVFGTSLDATCQLGVPEMLAVAFMVLLTVSCIFMNVIVIILFLSNKNIRSLGNMYYMSLAFADLLIGAITMPLNIYMQVMCDFWPFSSVACDLFICFDVLSSTASIMHLCVIAIDRYKVIDDPLGYVRRLSRKRVFMTIGGIWLASSGISFPGIAWWKVAGMAEHKTSFVDNQGRTYLECYLAHEVTYIFVSSAVSFYIPLFAMAFVYYKIYHKAVAQSRFLMAGSKNVGLSNYFRTRVTSNGSKDNNNNNENNNNNNNNNKQQQQQQQQDDGMRITLRAHRGGQHLLSLNHGGYHLNSVGTKSAALAITNNKKTSSSNAKCNKNDKNNLKAAAAAVVNNNNNNSSPPGAGMMLTRKQEGSNSSSIQRRKASLFSYQKSFTTFQKLRTILKEHKAARTLGLIMGVFILCWLPFFVLNVLSALLPTAFTKSLTFKVIFKTFTWCGYMNSVLNPFLYGVSNRTFRNIYINFLTCGRYRKNQQSKRKSASSVVSGNTERRKKAFRTGSIPKLDQEAIEAALRDPCHRTATVIGVDKLPPAVTDIVRSLTIQMPRRDIGHHSCLCRANNNNSTKLSSGQCSAVTSPKSVKHTNSTTNNNSAINSSLVNSKNLNDSNDNLMAVITGGHHRCGGGGWQSPPTLRAAPPYCSHYQQQQLQQKHLDSSEQQLQQQLASRLSAQSTSALPPPSSYYSSGAGAGEQGSSTPPLDLSLKKCRSLTNTPTFQRSPTVAVAAAITAIDSFIDIDKSQERLLLLNSRSVTTMARTINSNNKSKDCDPSVIAGTCFGLSTTATPSPLHASTVASPSYYQRSRSDNNNNTNDDNNQQQQRRQMMAKHLQQSSTVPHQPSLDLPVAGSHNNNSYCYYDVNNNSNSGDESLQGLLLPKPAHQNSRNKHQLPCYGFNVLSSSSSTASSSTRNNQHQPCSYCNKSAVALAASTISSSSSSNNKTPQATVHHHHQRMNKTPMKAAATKSATTSDTKITTSSGRSSQNLLQVPPQHKQQQLSHQRTPTNTSSYNNNNKKDEKEVIIVEQTV